MIGAGIFVALAAVLCAAAALAVLGSAQVYLSGSAAIEHDGLARGRPAPRWSLPDTGGVIRQSPPAAPLQLVIFADHALKSFPSVLDGLRELRDSDGGLEIVVLLRRPSDLTAPLLAMLGLDVPVVAGSPGLYARYNVRVGPFAMFVDASGQVRASSLVNYDWQIAKLRQVADLPLEQAGTARRWRAGAPGGRWPRRRPFRAAV
jgi:hypothetical protein